MANVLFGTPIYSDPGPLYTPTFSNGSWVASGDVAIANLQTRELADVARSTDAALASTKFDVDLMTARNVGAFALLKSNLTLAALVRLRGSTVSNFATTVYDSGWVNAFDAGISAEDYAAGYKNVPVALFPYKTISAPGRYWRVEINDTANGAGYIEIGRLVLAQAVQPVFNVDYGCKQGLETDSTASRTKGGPTIVEDLPRARNWTLVIEEMQYDQALGTFYEIQWRNGIYGQIFFAMDPDDTTHLHRRAALCRMKELSALEFPYYLRAGMPFSLVEEL